MRLDKSNSSSKSLKKMVYLISFMRLRANSWLRDHLFWFMLGNWIETQIYRQFTILCLNFINRVNCAARRYMQYSWGQANLWFIPLGTFMLIQKVLFQIKRTMDVHIEVYTIIAGRPRTCVLTPFFIFLIYLLFPGYETAIQTIVYHYSTNDDKKIIFWLSKYKLFTILKFY